MEKSKYIQPEISICNVETDQMMALSRSESPADEHIDVLTNMTSSQTSGVTSFKVSHSKRNGTTRRFPFLGQSKEGLPLSISRPFRQGGILRQRNNPPSYRPAK